MDPAILWIYWDKPYVPVDQGWDIHARRKKRSLAECKILEISAPFILRQSPDSDDYHNVFFVRNDGSEACCGQGNSLAGTVERYGLGPYPTWMTGPKRPEVKATPLSPSSNDIGVEDVDLTAELGEAA